MARPIGTVDGGILVFRNHKIVLNTGPEYKNSGNISFRVQREKYRIRSVDW